jgi:hypothetical protein
LGVAGRTTDILIDVVGYTTNTGLQQLVADVASKAAATSLPIARSARESDAPNPNGSATVLTTVTINVPVAGILQIVGSTLISHNLPGETWCWLSTGAGDTSSTGVLGDTSRIGYVGTGGRGSCSTNGAMPVAAGTHVVNLVSNASSGIDLQAATLDVLFVAGGTVTDT